MTIWVTDASPLIFLAKLDRLELVYKLSGHLYVPDAVITEIRAKPDLATQALDAALAHQIEPRAVKDRTAVELLLADLDLGEAEVIVLAKVLRADRVLMDDLDARRFAQRVGLKPVGTLGILLAGRLRGEIPSLKAEIDHLARLGFRAAPDLIDAVLKAAGE